MTITKVETDVLVEEYTPDQFDVWESFIDESVNGTIFHRQKFIGYHPADRFQDNSLLFYYKKRLIAVFPACVIERNGKTVLKSHAGTSYGGPVFNEKQSLRRVYSVMEALDEYAREKGFDQIEMRTSPKIFYKSFLDQLEFTLSGLGYCREAEELVTFYRMADYAYNEDILEFAKSFPTTCRKEIRKSAEHITAKIVETEEEVNRFHEILSDNLSSKYNKQPTHTLDELKTLLRLFPGEIFILGIYHGDRLVGGYTVITINEKGLHIFYAAMDYDYQIYRPLNLGLARLIQIGTERNMEVLNYGISTEDGGKYINWGLLRFKEDFGGTGALRTNWIKDIG